MRLIPTTAADFLDKNGKVSRVWRIFLESLTEDLDQASTSIETVTVSLVVTDEEAKISARPAKDNIINIEKEVRNAVREITSPLRSRIAELEKEIEELRRSIR